MSTKRVISINTSSRIYHKQGCRYVKTMSMTSIEVPWTGERRTFTIPAKSMKDRQSRMKNEGASTV